MNSLKYLHMLLSTHWKSLNDENDASVAFSNYISSKLFNRAATRFFSVVKHLLRITHWKILVDGNDESVAFPNYILSTLFNHAA